MFCTDGEIKIDQDKIILMDPWIKTTISFKKCAPLTPWVSRWATISNEFRKHIRRNIFINFIKFFLLQVINILWLVNYIFNMPNKDSQVGPNRETELAIHFFSTTNRSARKCFIAWNWICSYFEFKIPNSITIYAQFDWKDQIFHITPSFNIRLNYWTVYIKQMTRRYYVLNLLR